MKRGILAKTIDEIQNRVFELSQKFLTLSDLLNESNELQDRLNRITDTLLSAKAGIVYELAELNDEYKRLQSSKFSKIILADDISDLGNQLLSLTEQWKFLEEQLDRKKEELMELEFNREQLLEEVKDLGYQLQEMEKEFGFKAYSYYLPRSGWLVRAIFSPRNRSLVGAFSKLFEKTIEDYAKYLKELPPGELDQLIDKKATELRNILDQIKIAETELEKLQSQKKELQQFFLELSNNLKKEVLETEKFLVKIKQYLRTKPPSYKEVYLWLLDRVTSTLREEAKKFVASKEDVEIRISVEPIPKGSSVKKKAQGWWERIKGFVKKLWDAGRSLLDTLSWAKNELADFVYEIERAPDVEMEK